MKLAFAAVADQSGKLVVVYRDKTTPQEENWENRISYELTEALKYNDNVDALRIKSDIMISGSYSEKIRTLEFYMDILRMRFKIH